jgi:hypothetical protein
VTETVPLSETASAPVGGVAVTVTSVLGVNVRSEPAKSSTPFAQLKWNAPATATGRSADGEYVQVVLADGRTGWASAAALNIEGGIEAVPVIP